MLGTIALRQAVQFPPVQWTSDNKYFIQIGSFLFKSVIIFLILNMLQCNPVLIYVLPTQYTLKCIIKKHFCFTKYFYLPAYPYFSTLVTVNKSTISRALRGYQKCHLFMQRYQNGHFVVYGGGGGGRFVNAFLYITILKLNIPYISHWNVYHSPKWCFFRTENKTADKIFLVLKVLYLQL